MRQRLAFSPDGERSILRATCARSDPVRSQSGIGDISNRRTFITLEEGYGYIDGATVDTAGGYWLAVVGAAALGAILPNVRWTARFPLAVLESYQARVCGPDMRTLFVTSTKMKIDPKVFGKKRTAICLRCSPASRESPRRPLPAKNAGNSLD